MNWHWLILGKWASAVRDAARLFAWILKDRRVDFAVVALLAAGVGLVSIWLGAVIFFIAVAMLLRRCSPSQSVCRNGKVRSDTWLDEDIDDYAAGVGAYTYLRDDD